MSPHAISSPEISSYETSPTSIAADDAFNLINSQTSTLHRSPDDQIQDLICVGFGPASLAIAVALHDAVEARSGSIPSRTPRVRFLERQPRFAWHAGMLLPGARMQITFVKDLATLRNPRSEFTFLNYLHNKSRLVAFTNLGTFLPQRIEYEDYMRWCADHFSGIVDYSRLVQRVDPGSLNPRTGEIEYFNVTSVNTDNGQSTTLKAKHIVIAAGGRPNIPKCLPERHPRVIHSSQYATNVHKIFPEGSRPRTVAVIGGGQSAAECWHDVPTRFPGAQSILLIRNGALKPSDDSPFVNEIFNPEHVDDVFAQDPRLREEALALDRATNYGVVRIELLEQIYDEMYSYRIRHHSEEDWPHRLLNYRSVTGMRDVQIDGKPAVELQIQNDSGKYTTHKDSRVETLTVDLVVVASGYVRDSHDEMLQGLRQFMPGGPTESKKWTVQRDYAVNFERGSVQPDAGVWLQGCNEKTHGLSDTLLSILAVRGGEIIESIFKYEAGSGRKPVQSDLTL